MRFNPKARLDTRRTSDAGRGARSGGIPIPGGAAGGGVGGLIVVVVIVALTMFLGDGGPTTAYDTGRMSDTEDSGGVVLISDLTREDVEQAISAATAVGDDRIQSTGGGSVDPDSWTHGSADQRVEWFVRGYEQGTLDACDTFAAAAL